MRAIILLIIPHLLAAQAPDTAGFSPVWRFSVTDTVRLRRTPLDSSLSIALYRELDVRGTSMGWYLSVVAPQGPDPERNLLYHSLAWHGAYPTDLFAWVHRDQYFADDRVLPVYGYPYELRLACEGCTVAGDSTLVHFVTGTVAVWWRRLSHASPPASN